MWFAFYLFAFAVEVPIFILLVRGRVSWRRAALAANAASLLLGFAVQYALLA
jgi:hypothetical protein